MQTEINTKWSRVILYTFVATNFEIEINDMFSTLLKAMLATTVNSLGLGSLLDASWNLNSENLKSWITLQNAIYHLIENDPRYKIVVWDCDNRRKFSNHEIDERVLTLDENIIGNNVSISFEWSSDPSYRLILIRKNLARRIKTPVEESEGILNGHWANEYNWDEKKMEKVWREGPSIKARVNKNLYDLIHSPVGVPFGLTHNYERESKWLDFIDHLFEKNIIINHHKKTKNNKLFIDVIEPLQAHRDRESVRRSFQAKQAPVQKQHVHETTAKRVAHGNKRQGYGVLTYANGDKFIGSWLNGKRHGSGTIEYADERKFIGYWRDDKRQGSGVILYPDGRCLTGYWRDDKRQGGGTIKSPDGRVAHLGGAIVRPQTR